MPLIEARDLVFGYGAIPVLKGVSFSVDDGEVLGIIGPNGAGKTTLLRTLTGESLPRSGRVIFRDRDITATPPHRRLRSGVGRTFQVARVFPEFSVLENVVVAIESRNRIRGMRRGLLRGIRPAGQVLAEAHDRLRRLDLAAREQVEARHLAHGDRKRLELAMTIATGASVLMLDEPTAGMSPADRATAGSLLRDVIRENKLAVLLIEHDMDLVFALADRMLVLNYGEVVAIGTPGEIRDNPAVRDIYLGEELADA